jgi:hypothetical protein
MSSFEIVWIDALDVGHVLRLGRRGHQGGQRQCDAVAHLCSLMHGFLRKIDSISRARELVIRGHVLGESDSFFPSISRAAPQTLMSLRTDAVK